MTVQEMIQEIFQVPTEMVIVVELEGKRYNIDKKDMKFDPITEEIIITI